jgi:hypothetical protein
VEPSPGAVPAKTVLILLMQVIPREKKETNYIIMNGTNYQDLPDPYSPGVPDAEVKKI